MSLLTLDPGGAGIRAFKTNERMEALVTGVEVEANSWNQHSTIFSTTEHLQTKEPKLRPKLRNFSKLSVESQYGSPYLNRYPNSNAKTGLHESLSQLPQSEPGERCLRRPPG